VFFPEAIEKIGDKIAVGRNHGFIRDIDFGESVVLERRRLGRLFSAANNLILLAAEVVN